MWYQHRRPPGRRSGHGSCRDPCGTVDSDRVTKQSTRSDDPARADSDTTVQYAPGTGPRPLRRRAHTSGAAKGLWVAVCTDGRRCRHPARRMTWIGVLTTGATVTDGQSRWAIAAAEHTNGWRDWRPLSSQGHWRLAWQTLANSTSGPSKAAAGAARQTAPSLADSTERQQADDARTKHLGTRGDIELETVVPKMRERRDSGRKAAITNLPVKLGDHKLETGSKRQVATWPRFVDRSGSPLGYGSDTTAWPAGRVQVRLGWVGKSGRGGGCVKSNHLPSQNVSDQQAHQLYPPPPLNLNAADVKASSTGPGSSSCPAAAGDAQICNKGVVLSRPTATRSGARASTCQICLGEYVLIRNKTNKWL